MHRASALLRGGAPGRAARRVIEESARKGDGPEWRVLAAIWRLAEHHGVPLAPTLERFAHAMRDLSRIAERREVLLAAPRSTIRLVAVLPVVAMAFGALLGFDPLRALASPAGVAAMTAGAVLLVIGVRWAHLLARRLAEADWVAGWEFELAAIAIAGGGPPQAALLGVADCADAEQAEWVRLETLAPEGAVQRAARDAAEAGTSLRATLLAAAENSRAQTQAELERAAERLGVRILLPIGLCVLPAFVMLGVVPVLLAVLGGSGFAPGA